MFIPLNCILIHQYHSRIYHFKASTINNYESECIFMLKPLKSLKQYTLNRQNHCILLNFESTELLEVYLIRLGKDMCIIDQKRLSKHMLQIKTVMNDQCFLLFKSMKNDIKINVLNIVILSKPYDQNIINSISLYEEYAVGTTINPIICKELSTNIETLKIDEKPSIKINIKTKRIELNEPIEPVISVQPIETVISIQPIETVAPVKPIEIVKQVRSVRPVRSIRTKPIETKSIETIISVQQIETIKQVRSVRPVRSIRTKPIEAKSIETVVSVQPIETVKPIQQIETIVSVQPIETKLIETVKPVQQIKTNTTNSSWLYNTIRRDYKNDHIQILGIYNLSLLEIMNYISCFYILYQQSPIILCNNPIFVKILRDNDYHVIKFTVRTDLQDLHNCINQGNSNDQSFIYHDVTSWKESFNTIKQDNLLQVQKEYLIELNRSNYQLPRAYQIYISQSLRRFERKIKQEFSLLNYYSTTETVVFFGCYNQTDYTYLQRHKGKILLIWGGTDCYVLEKQIGNKNGRHNKYKVLNGNKITHIAISQQIYDKLKNIYNFQNVQYIHLKLLNYQSYVLTERKIGDSIYIYTSSDVQRAKEVYGSTYYQEIRKRLPDYNFIIAYGQYDEQEMIKIYQKCFIGLRLTTFDGSANTVQELAMLGIPCFHNGEFDFSLKWHNVEDIVQKIKELSKRKQSDPILIKHITDYFNYDVAYSWMYQ